MAHRARFYEDKEGTLCFHLVSPSIADTIAAPFEFDGPATEQHKREYSHEYGTYLREKELKTKPEPYGPPAPDVQLPERPEAVNMLESPVFELSEQAVVTGEEK